MLATMGMGPTQWEVMSDLKGFMPHALDPADLEGLDEEQQARVTNAKEARNSLIRRFLGYNDGSPTKPKQYRLSTWRFIQCLDHAFFVMTNAGLEQLASKGTEVSYLKAELQEEVRRYAEGPVRSLFVTADQASVGLTAMCFLQQGGSKANGRFTL